MSEFNFKSQICTDKVQSERLLALGLKKETADMCRQTTTLNGEPITYPSQDVWLNGSIITNNHFPAWSLHRLIEMIPNRISYESGYLTVEVLNGFHILYVTENCEQRLVSYRNDNLFDAAIRCIEFLIKEGYFNKEYLNE